MRDGGSNVIASHYPSSTSWLSKTTGTPAQGLCYLLEAAGYDVERAYDGNQGLEKALACCPEAILLDIGVPAIDGYAVARRLREIEALRHVYNIVAVTGYASAADQRKARAAGHQSPRSKASRLPPD